MLEKALWRAAPRPPTIAVHLVDLQNILAVNTVFARHLRQDTN